MPADPARGSGVLCTRASDHFGGALERDKGMVPEALRPMVADVGLGDRRMDTSRRKVPCLADFCLAIRWRERLRFGEVYVESRRVRGQWPITGVLRGGQ